MKVFIYNDTDAVRELLRHSTLIRVHTPTYYPESSTVGCYEAYTYDSSGDLTEEVADTMAKAIYHAIKDAFVEGRSLVIDAGDKNMGLIEIAKWVGYSV